MSLSAKRTHRNRTTENSNSRQRSVAKKAPFFSPAKSFFRPILQPQPKLTVNAPNDIYEKEADAVADQVMRMPDPQVQRQPMEEEEEMLQMKEHEPKIQRKCETCEAEEALQKKTIEDEEELHLKHDPSSIQMKCKECEQEEKMQLKSASQLQSNRQNEVSPAITTQLSVSKGRGVLLPKDIQQEMSHKMGRDFSGVKVHTDSTAIQMNRDLGAKAFTHRKDIYFNQGQFKPSSYEGKHLLAHELTHVVQQEGIQPLNNGFIQRLTCQEEYGPPGSEPEPNALSSQRGAAITRLRSNLNSWDPYLISKVERIANGLFSSEEELAWWGNWAVGLAVDLIDDAIPKPIGTLIKAFASAGEHIANKSIADARAKLAEEGVDAVIAYRTSQNNEGEAYIRQYYEELRSRTDESCAGYHQLLLDSIDEWWPQLDTSALPRARSLAQELMNQVRARHTLERLRREYEQCVEYALYRPGGIPTEEEERRAREDCRRETGYYPVTAC